MPDRFLSRRFVMAGIASAAAVLASRGPALALEPNVNEFKNPAGQNNRILLYIGARNCPTCKYYEASSGEKSREEVIRLATEGKFRYVELKMMMYVNYGDPAEWPQEFLWVKERFNSGTPVFVMINGKTNKIVRWHRGWSSDTRKLQLWEKIMQWA